MFVRGLGQPLQELLHSGGHGETGGSDAGTGPAAVAEDGHAGSFHEVTGEVAVAGVPDPLTVSLAEGGPPLVGELPEVGAITPRVRCASSRLAAVFIADRMTSGGALPLGM